MRAFMFTVAMQLQFAFAAQAALSEIPVKGSERILISVSDAVINLQANPTMKSLKIQLVDGAQEDFQVATSEGLIEIKNREVTAKEDFGKFPVKKRIIEIQGPPLALEIHAFDGQVNITKWTKETLVHLQKGRIGVKDSSGTLKVHSQTGDILITDQVGKVQVDTYKSSVTIRGLVGDLDLDNFSGETLIEKSKGFISVNQGQGTAKILSSQGTLQFELLKGMFQAAQFLGRIEGQTSEGPVSIMMAPEGEVNVKSQSGKVTIQAAAKAGSLLNLASSEGEIFVPNYLKVSRDGSQKSMHGRLKGEVQKGSIIVRSQNGTIIIK